MHAPAPGRNRTTAGRARLATLGGTVCRYQYGLILGLPLMQKI
jgi:hypothetical protein